MASQSVRPCVTKIRGIWLSLPTSYFLNASFSVPFIILVIHNSKCYRLVTQLSLLTSRFENKINYLILIRRISLTTMMKKIHFLNQIKRNQGEELASMLSVIETALVSR